MDSMNRDPVKRKVTIRRSDFAPGIPDAITQDYATKKLRVRWDLDYRPKRDGFHF
jgi:hypothetical protein